MNFFQLNFTISYILTGIILLFLAIFVYVRNPKKFLNRIYTLYTLSISWWALFSIPMIQANTELQATFWDRICLFGTVFIPPTFLHFNYTFLGINKKRSKAIKTTYLFSFIFFLLLFTPYFLKGTELKETEVYFSKPSVIYVIFVIYFFSITIHGIYLFYKNLKIASTETFRRQQLFYLFWATLLGYFGGGLNYNLVFNIKPYEVIPFGNYLIGIYGACVAYAIVRYRLMDIRIVAVRTLVFVVVYVPILAVPYVLGYVFKLSWVLPTVLETIFAPGGLFIYLKIQEIAERKILQKEYNQAGEIRDLAGGLIRLDDVGELGRVIVGGLEKITKAENISLYILQENKTSYSMSYSRGELKSPKSLAVNNPLVEYIQDQREPVILSELQNKAKEAAQVLIEKKAAVAVPAVEKENLMGLIFLGEKPDNRAYSQIELTALGVLARQVGFTVQVIQFIEEKEEMQRARNEMQRMKEFEYLTSAIGHEIGNGIQAIELASSVLVRKRDLTDMFAENKKAENAVREQVANIKNNIENIRQVSEALKGYIHKGDIGKIEKVDLQDLIKRVLVLAKVRNLGMKAADIRIKGTADVVCNPSALQSVFSNLINNSYDAIIQEKQYREENNDTREYKGIIEITITGGSDAAEIHIRDNGFGMSQEVQKQIFIPLFTTKSHEDKKDRRLTGGTGIGMFTIQKMLASQGGYIEVYESEEHKGTDFLIKILGRQ